MRKRAAVIVDACAGKEGMSCQERGGGRPGRRIGSYLEQDGVMDFTVRPLTAEEWPALEDLFGRAGASNGCWCMYWRIGPRYKERAREENKHDLEHIARSGPAPGLLAFDGGTAVSTG